MTRTYQVDELAQLWCLTKAICSKRVKAEKVRVTLNSIVLKVVQQITGALQYLREYGVMNDGPGSVTFAPPQSRIFGLRGQRIMQPS